MADQPTPRGKGEQMTKPQFLIRKYGGFYRPNSQGYTGSAIQAGRYTLDEAEQITHPNGPDGPRDGMTFIHEDDLQDEDWAAYRALQAERDAALARVAQLEAALPRAYMRGRDDAAKAAVGHHFPIIGEFDKLCEERKAYLNALAAAENRIRALPVPVDLGKEVADE